MSLDRELRRSVRRDVLSHPERDALARLVGDIVARRAESRVAFSGSEFVEKRRTEHGVGEDATIGGVKLVPALERAPENDRERAVLAILTLRAIELELVEGARDARLDRWVRGLEWLELETDLAPLADAREEWSESTLARMSERIDERRRELAREDDAGSLAARARLALWTSFGGATAETSRSDAARADDTLRDGASTSGERPPKRSPRIDGRHARGPRTGWAVWITGLTGIALLSGLARAVGRALGTQRSISIELRGNELSIAEVWTALGRPLRTIDRVVRVSDVLEAAHDEDARATPRYIGALAFALGLIGGGFALVEGTLGGSSRFAMIGAGLLVGGIAFDLLVELILARLGGRARLVLVARRGVVTRVEGPADDVLRFHTALAAAMRGPGGAQ